MPNSCGSIPSEGLKKNLVPAAEPSLTATKAIRDWEQRNNTSAVPIVAITSHAMQDYQQRFLESGMHDYISKPFNRDNLIQKIGELITATDSRRSRNIVN